MSHAIREGSHVLILEAIAGIQSAFIAGAENDKLYELALDHLLSISESQYAFIGDFVITPNEDSYFRGVWNKTNHHMLVDGESADLFTPATKISPGTFLNTLVCNKEVVFYKGCPNERLFVSENRSVFKNIVGIPLIYRKELLGALILGNSELFDDYSLIFSLLHPLFESCAGLLHSHAQERSKKAAEDRLAFLAENDALTKLPNRAVFTDRLQHSFERAKRRNTLVGLMFLDIDHFKIVNDTLGHDAGDLLLVEVASRIKKSIRCEDTLARIGGDEFTIILEGLTTHLDAGRVADKIFNSLRVPFFLGNEEHYIGLSVGIAVEPPANLDVVTLTKYADMAMYDAKKNGRNNYKFYTKDLNTKNRVRLSMGDDLHRAQRNNEFYMVYQPQVSISDNTVVGHEALLRWDNKNQQGPDVFVPVLEDTGLIVPVGQWIIENTCQQQGEWFEQKLVTDSSKISINLSPKQFLDPRIIDVIKRSLETSHLNPSSLIFEITETALMQDDERCMEIMFALKDLGVTFSLDDFGTGYSSLSHLQKFPISHLKIDRSFVSGVATSSNDASICAAIISMAHKMGITVTAEGVENKSQLDFLKQCGCNNYQGYYYSKPLNVERVKYFLNKEIKNKR